MIFKEPESADAVVETMEERDEEEEQDEDLEDGLLNKESNQTAKPTAHSDEAVLPKQAVSCDTELDLLQNIFMYIKYYPKLISEI